MGGGRLVAMGGGWHLVLCKLQHNHLFLINHSASKSLYLK